MRDPGAARTRRRLHAVVDPWSVESAPAASRRCNHETDESMRVVVLGGGIIGTASAWFLPQDGHDVTRVERHPAVAVETSFGNAGQVSVGQCEPGANPAAPLKILQWLGKEDAPLLFRPRADPQQWIWGLQFLSHCTPGSTRGNIRACLRL